MNEENKHKFIETLPEQNRPNMLSNFKKLIKYEMLFKKDLSKFSIKEIDKMYSTMDAVSSKTLNTINMRLYRYSIFCGVEDNNYQYFTNYESLSPYASDSIVSKNRLYKLSERFVNPCDKFLLLAPYYGFTSDDNFSDMVTLRESHIIDEHTIILDDNRRLMIDPRFYQICVSSLQTFDYVKSNRKNIPLSGDGPIKFALNSNKNEKGITNYYVMIVARYGRYIRPVAGNKFTYKYIRTCGIVERTDSIVIDHNLKTYAEIWDDETFQETVAKPFKLTSISMFYNRYKPYSLLIQ